MDFSKPRISFGSHAMVYTQTSNDMKTRAVLGISLHASNTTGVYYFVSLYSVRRVHGCKWDEFPVDDYVIKRLEYLDEEENQPLMHNGMPSFEWALGMEVDDELEEKQHEPTLMKDEIYVNSEDPMLEIEPLED